MKIILPSKHITQINKNDKRLISGCNLYADIRKNTTYVRVFLRNGKRIYLHRLIMKIPKNMTIDHIDGNGLNNTRKNLRICTQAQNAISSVKKNKNKKYKGVYFDKRRKKWWSQIYYLKKGYFLGYYDNEISAAKSYNKKAKELHKEYARLNRI